MSLSVKSHADRFLEYLEQKNPEAAYTRAEACLLQSNIDQKELYQICTHLDTLLDQISPKQAETLLLHLLKALQEFPVFAEEQAHTLTLYGEICLSKEDSLSAMRCFATAHVLNPSYESAQRLLSPLLPSIFEGLETQLQRAAGLGNPVLFQQLLTRFTHKFGIDTPRVQQIYQIAERVYKGIQNPKTKMLFIDLLDVIEAGIKVRIPPRANPLPYLQHLKKAREGFEHQTATRQYQRERGEAFRLFFGELFQDALFILGEPPCGYDIRAMGSLAREEVCPYSDLEYFILIEEEEHRSYFQKLANIFDLQILSLGETDPKHQELFNFGQKFGLEIDHQANPAYHDSLIGRPEQFFALPQDPSPDDLKAYKSRLRSVSLQSNHEFGLPQPTLDFRVLLEMRKEEFASLRPLQSTICEVKREFVEPLFHFISDLGLHFGLEESNTLDLIEVLPLFNPLSKELLKIAVSDLYRLRVRLHLAHGGINERVSLVPSLGLTILTQQEIESLKRVHELVLIPLYDADLEDEIDLIAIALQHPNETNVALAAQFIEEDHSRYYTMLCSPDLIALQRTYLDHVPDHAGALAQIPNRAGYRLSKQLEEEQLQLSLESMTTGDSSSGLKIHCPLIGEKYLTSDAAKNLLDSRGHILARYENSLHRVNYYRDLHFKELPYQPMMQYAKDSLIHRIMGKAAPTTTLARFEVLGKNLAYPVLISETIQGERIDSSTSFFSRHLTWLCLCEILTKPGDGRIPNYVVNQGKIYCIDNDITFIEPVVRNFIGQLQVNFCSALFTLGQPLDPDVLNQFCALEPDLILTDWLQELQEQEKLYCSLFSEAELETFYTQDKDRRFSPTLMFAKGTITSLCTQFYHLQDVLRQGVFADPSLLLRELISLDESIQNQVGILVERNYRKALTKPFASRLKEATALRADQSMTSQKAMELNYKTIPTFEEIQTRKTYSLEEALKEFCLLEAQKMWNGIFIIGNREEYFLEADFSTLQDPEREKLILKALQFLCNARKQKPTSITLRHTQTLTPAILKTLLHPSLRSLDLSYGALVSEGGLFTVSTLSQIETLSPNLEELYLEGCPSLVQPTITLPQLRRLNISRCPNIKSLNLEKAQLQELKINHSPRLRTVQVSITPETEVDWKETPGPAISHIAEQWYQLGKRYAEGGDGVPRNPEKALALWRKAEGNGVPRDLERALALWEKAAAGKNQSALEALLEGQYQLGKKYAEGDGVPRDPEKALALWKKAAAGGHTHAQDILKWNKRFNKHPTSLNLSNNQIGNQGARAIADALKINQTLASLNLGNNKIGAQGAIAIAKALKVNHTLASLNLGNNQIRGQGARAIAEALKINQTLAFLDLSVNKIELGASDIAKALKVNHTLASLNLRHNGIWDTSVRAIAEALKVNHSLASLNLSSNQIGDQGASAIADALKVNHSLASLNLRNSQVGDRGIQIGDQGAIAIAEALMVNHTLASLNLWDNQIGGQGAYAIAEALKVNQTLACLELSSNQIGDYGAIAIAEALKVNQTLASLELSSNRIGDYGAIAIAEALRINHTLASLNLRHNGIWDTSVRAIAEALKVNYTLAFLNLSSNQICGQGARDIAEGLKVNHSLTSLNLGNNKIGDHDARAIADALKVNHSLASLYLGGNEIEDHGAFAIAEALKVNHTLASLNLVSNQIRDQGVVAIAEALKVNHTLASLSLNSYTATLWGNQIGDQGAVAIAETLKVNHTLVSLSLQGNQIGDQGAVAIVEALKVNHTLVSLSLQGSQIWFQDTRAIVEALKINHTLTTLYLSNEIGEKNPRACKKSVSRNKSLQASAWKTARKGDVQLFHLLDQGVSIYSLDEKENTFLHIAAIYGHTYLILPLLDRAQNPMFPSWRNKENKTALDLAREKGHTAILELLSS